MLLNNAKLYFLFKQQDKIETHVLGNVTRLKQ